MQQDNMNSNFDWDVFYRSMRKMFPYISDEYWTKIRQSADVSQYIDLEEFGKFFQNQPWIETYSDIVKKQMKQFMKDNWS